MFLKPLEHYSHYIQYGAYPYFKESISDYPMRLLEVINITIESDLAKIFNIDNEKQSVLKRVLGMLCSTSPYEISKSKLSKDTNISWATLSKYLSYMKEGDLIHLIEAPHNQKRLNKAQKMLLNNPKTYFMYSVQIQILARFERAILSRNLTISMKFCTMTKAIL